MYLCCIVQVDGCLIEGQCYDNGDVNTDGTCQVCDPARSADRWSISLGNVLQENIYLNILWVSVESG